jgi:hypothetical protein
MGNMCPYPLNNTVTNLDAPPLVVSWIIAKAALANSINCNGYGSAAAGEMAMMRLESYALENGYDYMYALDGSNSIIGSITGSGTTSATFCAISTSSTSPAITANIVTDGSNIAGGFTLSMWSGSHGWYCNGNAGGA